MRKNEVDLVFDPDFYRRTNLDVDFRRIEPRTHFVEIGWLEGRPPNGVCNVVPYFRSSLLDKRPPDLAKLCQALSPCDGSSQNGDAILRHADAYHAALRAIREIIDYKRYAEAVSEINQGNRQIDLVVHFSRIGCALVLDGSLSSREFLSKEVEARSRVARWISLARDADLPHLQPLFAGIIATIEEKNKNRIASLGAEYGLSEDQLFQLTTVSGEFDEEYYVKNYRDVEAAGIDPLIHFTLTGWAENRNPNAEFSTEYYLKHYGDIKDSGINPFYHFIVAGRSEGRRGNSATVAVRDWLTNLTPASQLIFESPGNSNIAKLPNSSFARIIKELMRRYEPAGVALTLSHDCYLDSVGGTQIFIADEEAGFRRRDYLYINICPVKTRLFIPEYQDDYVVSCNGEKIGIIEPSVLRGALSLIDSHLPRVLVIHSLLGHDISGIIALADAFKSENTYFWIHDFSSLCVNFNLLRNGRSYCGAPALDSMSCRVCFFGAERVDHLAKVERLFEKFDITVIAPSESAASIWATRSTFRNNRILVIPHVVLKSIYDAGDSRMVHVGSGSNPLRVAFLGYPVAHKGYEIFEKISARFVEDPRYEFFFGSKVAPPGKLGMLKHFEVKTTATDRDAASRAIVTKSIHLVINPPIWPETFNYVAYEAICGGAFVYTLSVSGNIAAIVHDTGAGAVFNSMEEMMDSFESGRVIRDVQQYIDLGKRFHAEIPGGTTAALLDNASYS